MTSRRRAHRAVFALCVLWSTFPAWSCGLEPTSPPPITGPATLGVALRVTATPDLLPRDGVSIARVAIQAQNARGLPAAGLTVWAEVVPRGTVAEVGELSHRTAITDRAGWAELTYTAPLGPAPSSDLGTDSVAIEVTPVDDDYANALPRVVHIRVVSEPDDDR